MKCIFGFDVKTTLNRNNVDASSSYRSVWVSRQQIAPKFEALTGLKIHKSKREIKSYSYKIFQAQTKQTSEMISVLSTAPKEDKLDARYGLFSAQTESVKWRAKLHIFVFKDKFLIFTGEGEAGSGVLRRSGPHSEVLFRCSSLTSGLWRRAAIILCYLLVICLFQTTPIR